jgi:hypothetical protein
MGVYAGFDIDDILSDDSLFPAKQKNCIPKKVIVKLCRNLVNSVNNSLFCS